MWYYINIRYGDDIMNIDFIDINCLEIEIPIKKVRDEYICNLENYISKLKTNLDELQDIWNNSNDSIEFYKRMYPFIEELKNLKESIKTYTNFALNYTEIVSLIDESYKDRNITII